MRRAVSAAPAELLFVVSAVFHYLGPGFAVLLFAYLDPLGAAWLRIGSAALIFALWTRPWRGWAALPKDARWLVIAMGLVLALMNVSVYQAIARLPLGTVAAIEFVGPIVLAAIAIRTIRNGLALVLAIAGVYLLTEVRLAGEPIGYLFTFANAVLFAVYIVLAHRVSRRKELSGINGLGLAMLFALVFATPLGIVEAAPAILHPLVLGAGIGVGISSSVIPYVFDQLAMRRLSRMSYSLLLALLPATATVIGLIVLAQAPTLLELLAIGLVIASVALRRESDPDPEGHGSITARRSNA